EQDSDRSWSEAVAMSRSKIRLWRSRSETWIARLHTERHHMSAMTVLSAVGLVLCLTGLVPTAGLTAQPSRQDASPSQSLAHLTQPEVLTLAKTAARKVVRQKLSD